MSYVKDVARHFRLVKHIKPVEITIHPDSEPAWGFVDTSSSPLAYLMITESAGRFRIKGPMSEYSLRVLTNDPVLESMDRSLEEERHFDRDNHVDLHARVPKSMEERGLAVSRLASEAFAK